VVLVSKSLKKDLPVTQAAFAVDCPVCFADPGEPCFSEDGGRIVSIHDSRVNDFRGYVATAVAQERAA
jgi:hypothetical protein